MTNYKNYRNFHLIARVLSTFLGAAICNSLIISQSAQAFTIDFKNPAVITSDGTRTINTSVELDAIALDSAGGQSIDLDLSDGNGAQTYSTTLNNIGDLWNPIGLDITIQNNKTLGLFNSECVPAGGSNSAAAPANIACDIAGTGDGDPDLATGNGVNPNGNDPDVNFNTTPQGNLLIAEENVGNGIPDDGIDGDIIVTFDQNILSQVRLESVTIVDDAEGDIIVTFTDNSTQTIEFNSQTAGSPIIGTEGTLLNPNNGDQTVDLDEYVAGENALAIIGGFTQQDVAELEIDFLGSGGFGAFAFSKFAGPQVDVPFEFSPGLGLLLSGGGLLGIRYFKQRKQNKQLETIEK
ncbi:MAG TPA: hypothetical protein ACFCUY_11530 [Xenococcaceae cyanobacterium]